MIAELGLFSLILALISSLMLAVIPLIGLQLGRSHWMDAARTYVVSQFFSLHCPIFFSPFAF